MNPGNGKGSMSNSSKKSSDPVSEFPAGLRVLVVDDDPTCLMIVEKMLKTCLYEVTTCNRAEKALVSLQANRNGFDIVISDVHMPDMDGFKLLERIGLEMDLPVIMMSADDGKQVVMKGVTHGACDYLIKPIRMEELKNIWQHVVRKRKSEWKELEHSQSIEDGVDRSHKPSEDADYSSSMNEGGNWKSSKRRKDDEDELDERDDTSTLKKPRVVWSVELHQQFVAAVNQLGIDKAVPKKILELMNVPGLTRENVASHLQGGVSSSFMGTQDGSFGPISSLSGLDLQALAVAGQLPAQGLATLQAAGFARSSPKGSLSIPMIDQRNLFSFDNSKFKFGEGQCQQQPHIGNKPLNLLHGIPTTMEPNQLANLHQSFENMSSMQVPESQSNSLLMRGPARLTNNVGQPVTSNGLSGGVLPRNTSSENGRGAGSYTNPVSQTTTSALTFPMNHVSELPGSNSFPPLGTSPGIPSLTQKGPFQNDIAVNSDIKGLTSGGYIPGYYVLNELQQIRTNDWDLQSAGLNFDAPQNASSLAGSLDSSASSIYVHQGISRSGPVRNSSNGVGTKPNFPVEGTHHQNLISVVNSSVRIKSENVVDSGCPSTLYPDHFDQEDLMSALLKQQEGVGPANPDFDFDGYNLDNIPV